MLKAEHTGKYVGSQAHTHERIDVGRQEGREMFSEGSMSNSTTHPTTKPWSRFACWKAEARDVPSSDSLYLHPTPPTSVVQPQR